MKEIKQLPEAFVDDMRSTLGDTEAERLFMALCEEPSVSVRINSRKWEYDDLHNADRVPWCATGFYLNQRPPFTFDPLFHAGAYYVQEASSMFIEQLVRQYASDDISTALDLCAAPGGKSTLLRELLPEGSLLVCNEPMAKRAQVLAENMTKWGNPDVIVTQSMPSAFTSMADLFDLILTDVPCSGEGMFRKDDEAIDDWSPANVELCWQRQRDILTDIWPALKPGGLLIYSTCTFNRHENEDNVEWIANTLGAETLSSDHFYPSHTRGEGFFCAALRKAPTPTPTEPQSNAFPTCATHKKVATGFEIVKEGHTQYAIRSAHTAMLRQLRLTANVIQAGVRLGDETKKGFVPAPAVALQAKKEDIFGEYPRVELGYEDAVAYLRGEALRLSGDTPKGFVIVTFQGMGLGFAKNIGSRANNLYPDAWRIRSTYTKPFTLNSICERH